LLKRREDFHWIVIGRGCQKLLKKDSFLKFRQYLTLQDEIKEDVPQEGGVLGKINNLPSPALIDYYRASDVFVFPSLFESFGIVLIEAMAAGLPIVTTDAPGCRDLIHGEQEGIQVATTDYEAMAKAIDRILSDADFRKKIIQNAHRAVESNYRLDVVADRYFNLYQELAPNAAI